MDMHNLRGLVDNLVGYVSWKFELFEKHSTARPEYMASFSIDMGDIKDYDSITPCLMSLFTTNNYYLEMQDKLTSEIGNLKTEVETLEAKVVRLEKYEAHYKLEKDLRHNNESEDE